MPHQLLRNKVLDLSTIVPTTAYHRRSYAERYSRYKAHYVNVRGRSMQITCRQHRQGQAHHTDEHHVYSGASAEGDGVPALPLAYRTGRASALRYLAWNLGAVPMLPGEGRDFPAHGKGTDVRATMSVDGNGQTKGVGDVRNAETRGDGAAHGVRYREHWLLQLSPRGAAIADGAYRGGAAVETGARTTCAARPLA
jgi:hypothetical protein